MQTISEKYFNMSQAEDFTQSATFIAEAGGWRPDNTGSVALTVNNLLFSTLWANSADDRLVIFPYFFSRKKYWHFKQIGC